MKIFKEYYRIGSKVHKIILVLFLGLPLFFAVPVNSQEPINKVDSCGYKQGVWLEYEVLPLSIEEKNILMPDPLDSTKLYVVDKLDFGDSCFVIKCIGKYHDGLKDGLWTEYYPNGQFKSQIQYQKGIPFGQYETFWPNGKLKTKCTIGVADSVFIKAYKKNGDLLIQKKTKKQDLIKVVYTK